MDSDLAVVRQLFVKSLHNPVFLNDIIRIALKNQSNNFAMTQISKVIMEGVYYARPDDKLYAFYVLDSLIRSLGYVYANIFAKDILEIFLNTYTTINDVVKRRTLMFFRKKWAIYFPKYIFDRLDDEIHKIDSNAFNVRTNVVARNVCEKRKAPMYFEDNLKSKFLKYENPTSTMNIFQPNLFPTMPNYDFPPTKMPIMPSAMYPHSNNYPPNIQLPYSTTSNTTIPQQLTFPNTFNNQPSNSFIEPTYNKVSEFTPNIFDLANKPNELDPESIALNVMKLFPNLSRITENISTKDLDLNNYSFSEFSKINEEEINKLYKGIPCKQCGMRFQDIHVKEYKEHMRLHEYMSENPLVRRHYNLHYTEWVKAPKITHTKSEEPIFQHPLFADDSKNICGVCYERFVVKLDDESGDFMLQNARLVDGAVYHDICVKDIHKKYDYEYESDDNGENDLKMQIS